MATGEDKPNGREAQRQETRQRVYAAAVAEFKRAGMAAADVGVIAKEAGVARGTFYFHFPTKEHVLAELERHEEARLAAQLEKFLARPHRPSRRAGRDRPADRPDGAAGRQGALPRDARAALLPAPPRGAARHRPVGGLPHDDPGGRAVGLARDRGEAYPEADALRTAQFFMLGLYAMLITSHDQPTGGSGRDPRQLRRHGAQQRGSPLATAAVPGSLVQRNGRCRTCLRAVRSTHSY